MSGQGVDYIGDADRNPFGMDPPCDRFVPGYGDTGAHFHVIGDSPAVHGGLDTGIPFTDRPWSTAFFDALRRAGLVDRVQLRDGVVELDETVLSYRYMCDSGSEEPTDTDYAALDPFFDAELRAITAHVLLPVGERATVHVLDTYTARSSDGVDMTAVHGTEIRGSGRLMVPIREPVEWTGDDRERLVDGLRTLRASDYRRQSDPGAIPPGRRVTSRAVSVCRVGTVL